MRDARVGHDARGSSWRDSRRRARCAARCNITNVPYGVCGGPGGSRCIANAHAGDLRVVSRTRAASSFLLPACLPGALCVAWIRRIRWSRLSHRVHALDQRCRVRRRDRRTRAHRSAGRAREEGASWLSGSCMPSASSYLFSFIAASSTGSADALAAQVDFSAIQHNRVRSQRCAARGTSTVLRTCARGVPGDVVGLACAVRVECGRPL